MPIYDPKLAAGNPQIGRRPMLTRQDLEAAKARNNFRSRKPQPAKTQ